MTAVFVALGCGFLAARLAWILLRGMLSAPVFQRANYRGHRLPTAGGLIVVAAAVLIEGARTVVGSGTGVIPKIVILQPEIEPESPSK